jgi:hypothetical protein
MMYTASLLTGDSCSLPFGLPSPTAGLEQAWAQHRARGVQSGAAMPLPMCPLHPDDLPSQEYGNHRFDSGPPAPPPSQSMRRIRHVTIEGYDQSGPSAVYIPFPWICVNQARTSRSSGPNVLAARA